MRWHLESILISIVLEQRLLHLQVPINLIILVYICVYSFVCNFLIIVILNAHFIEVLHYHNGILSSLFFFGSCVLAPLFSLVVIDRLTRCVLAIATLCNLSFPRHNKQLLQ
jgi:hypothetical protein